MKERRVAVEGEVGNIELSAEIAFVRTLDLDNAGAEIGQTQRSGRAGEELREVNNEEDPGAVS
jgi:hypothetical protein